jgi:hypothetical protein
MVGRPWLRRRSTASEQAARPGRRRLAGEAEHALRCRQDSVVPKVPACSSMTRLTASMASPTQGCPMLLHPTKMERCRGIPPHSVDSDPRGRDRWGVHAQMTPVSAPGSESTRLDTTPRRPRADRRRARDCLAHSPVLPVTGSTMRWPWIGLPARGGVAHGATHPRLDRASHLCFHGRVGAVVVLES